MLRSIFAFGALFAVCWGSLPSSYRPPLSGQAIGAVESAVPFYQADIQHYGQHVCSGAVIGKYDVLTAAHCVEWLRPEDLTVIVGNVVLDQTQGIHQVAQVQTHPLFDAKSLDYDAAIVKVQKPFTFGRYVDSLPIPEVVDQLNPGDVAMVSGRIAHSRTGNNFVMLAEATITSQDYCNETYLSNQSGITDRMVCSGMAFNDTVPIGCLADPGAPLVANGKLYGIASWGDACTPVGPNVVVYTDVTKLEYFLRRNTFIHERAMSEVCAALQLIVSLLPMVPVVPAWVVTAINLLLKLLGC